MPKNADRLSQQINNLLICMTYRGADLIVDRTGAAGIRYHRPADSEPGPLVLRRVFEAALALRYIRAGERGLATARYVITGAGRDGAKKAALGRLEANVFKRAQRVGYFDPRQVWLMNRLALEAGKAIIYEIAPDGQHLNIRELVWE